MKRIFDIVASFFGLLVFSPVLLPVMFLVWRQDGHSPFYIAPRVGLNEHEFSMVKLRSMVKDADKSGVDSTSASDTRITKVGAFIRKFKLDEITQLWNVFLGDMSLVGPRPNVKSETDKYTDVEKGLLKLRPGITDFSSIVFSDEGDILDGKADPDLSYNQLIRPWKSRLGLVYIDNNNMLLDIKIILVTIIAIFSRTIALKLVNSELIKMGVDRKLIEVASRKEGLVPSAPPGADSIVME